MSVDDAIAEAVAPERLAEVLARFRVPNEAALRALDVHWEARLAERPEERTAFVRAFGMFVDYLRRVQRERPQVR